MRIARKTTSFRPIRFLLGIPAAFLPALRPATSATHSSLNRIESLEFTKPSLIQKQEPTHKEEGGRVSNVTSRGVSVTHRCKHEIDLSLVHSQFKGDDDHVTRLEFNESRPDDSERPKKRNCHSCNLPPMPCAVSHNRAASSPALGGFF